MADYCGSSASDELALLFTGAKAPTKDSPDSVAVTSLVEADIPPLGSEGTNVNTSTSVEPKRAVQITNASKIAALDRGLSGHTTAPSDESAVNVREATGVDIALGQLSTAEPHVPSPTLGEVDAPAETRAPLDAQASSLSSNDEPPKEGTLPSIIGLARAQASAVETSNALGVRHPLFAISAMGVDRRLLVNRKRQLQMYRVYVYFADSAQTPYLTGTIRWMQAKFKKN
ncbi:methyltransferase domain protein [Ceratobasidium sp. AG-Ba]|nr:methyltransferase domain protein [Ceratobasidium sp. AG-Ba]QRW02940.1 methyltransferase domain protein [Ceratobasidium sp. AG-Ba]